VDGRDLKESVQEGFQGGRNFGQEARGEDISELGNFEAFLGREDGGEALRSTNTQGVTGKTDLGVVGGLNKRLDVGINVLRGVELKTLALEGEDLWRGHGGVVCSSGGTKKSDWRIKDGTRTDMNREKKRRSDGEQAQKSDTSPEIRGQKRETKKGKTVEDVFVDNKKNHYGWRDTPPALD
jgi:hypothetical protein